MQSEGRVLFLAYNGILSTVNAAFPLYGALARLRGVPSEEIRQRLGHVERQAGSPVWIQAASVGEVGVAAVLMDALRRCQVSLPFYLTTTTRTGQDLAHRSKAADLGLGYFPLDFRRAVNRALAAIQPSALLLVETELWPNLLAESGRRGIPVLIVNGRISDRAFRRYGLVKPLFSAALEGVRLACVQTDLDRDRFVTLGLPVDRVRVTGNMKFAAASKAADPGFLLRQLGIGPNDELWIGGSTAEGEEDAILTAFRRLAAPPTGRRVLVLAPRRPERFEDVAGLLARSGLPWRRRSASAAQNGAHIILLDTLGELPLLYATATVAFVGGSLTPIGGHNIIEPAMHGVAPIFGPHIENIRDVGSLLLGSGAAFQVRDRFQLGRLFEQLASDPSLRQVAGEGARRIVLENRHSADATAREILPYLQAGTRAAR